MQIQRRNVLAGAGAMALARPALAQGNAEPIRIGWLAALTGPSSAPAVGFDRGVQFAAAVINSAGGVKGRKVEIVTRDTQGDPTKAVNAVQDLISRAKVHAVWGPTNSGESLAVTPLMARAKMPNIHPCVVDSLIDTVKYPNAFRIAPSNGQWDDAVRHYTIKTLGAKDVAVFGDTTGYGTTAVAASVSAFGKDGAKVVYQSQIDSAQPDVSPDMLRARDAGAKAIVVWTVAVGLLSRLMNARASMGWDVPILGHPSLGSGEIRGLLDKPANWDKVYMVGYRSCSFDSAGKLPARSQEFLSKLKGKVDLADTLLWWVACGSDAVNLVGSAVGAAGDSSAAAIIADWNKTRDYPGVFGDYSFTASEHNGYPQDGVVMSQANSQKDGAFTLAPG
ncbi:ABC transporter substrate-binding protein [Acidisphaera sp. L21]|uniref:ABC transporter substrate-binding protein n=1 Tax=Acidisphaera sp. L21 TaxID=1641851 RepID=UPI001C20A48E|nr:ABC transporter substrate-binding protein [Acidisphaera sp. L21]